MWFGWMQIIEFSASRAWGPLCWRLVAPGHTHAHWDLGRHIPMGLRRALANADHPAAARVAPGQASRPGDALTFTSLFRTHLRTITAP